MIGKIRSEYITICPLDASDEMVETMCEQLIEQMKQEDMLKEMGIDLDKLLGDLF